MDAGDLIIGTMAELRDLTGHLPMVHSYPDVICYTGAYLLGALYTVVVPRGDVYGYDVTVRGPVSDELRLDVCSGIIAALDTFLAA